MDQHVLRRDIARREAPLLQRSSPGRQSVEDPYALHRLERRRHQPFRQSGMWRPLESDE
jgi:hypothetical protein